MKNLLLIAAFSLMPVALAAQTARADSVAVSLQKVDSGAALRVRADRRTTYGKFTGVGTNALVIETPAGIQAPVRFDTVDEIFRQGHYAKRGAIIGGATGAVLLTGFGALIVSALCENQDGCAGDYATVAVYGVGVGGGGGALLGAGLGYLAKRWIKIY